MARVRRARGKGSPLRIDVDSFQNLGALGVLPTPSTSRSDSRPPMSQKRPTETGTTRGGPHHSPRLRLDQCLLCCQVGHRASECPNKGKTTSFQLGMRAFGTYALGCAVFDGMWYGATVEATEEDQDESDIQDFVAFSFKSLERFAILDGGATKTVSGFTSVQPAVDQYEGATVETTDVGFTFAGTNNQGHRSKERSRLNHPHVNLHDEESEHEHKHTSTSEDDLLKLLGYA